MKNPFIVHIAILFAVLFLIVPDGYGQDPTTSPAPDGPTAAAPAEQPVDQDPSKSAAPEPTPTPEPPPPPDLWHREQATGDWNGDRERLKAEGLEMDLRLTQFYQGVAAGGLRRNSTYTGIFELKFKFDLGKMNPKWKFWSAEVQTETRFGGPLVGGIGTINPVNTAAIIPATRGQVVSITALNFTRIIPKDLAKGDLFVIGFGRYNLINLIQEDFFAGSGIDRFFNVAQIGPLTALRQIPLITNGATFVYVKGGEPRFTLAVLDPNDHSVDSGLDNLFADGVTFSPSFIIPTKYFGKSAKHSFGGAITTKQYNPFDTIRPIILPGPARIPVPPKRGSWSVNYVFRQYLVERAKGDGWGFFSQVSIADTDTSPISRFFDLGLGGNGLFKSRPRDEFGIAYAYTDLSKIVKQNIDVLTIGNRAPRVEHQFEAFYNIHLAPWLRLTGDLQIIRPTISIAKTAIVPGIRLEMIF